MTDSARMILVGAVLVTAIFLALHEQHYRARRDTLGDAELEGLRGEVEAIKRILREDRHA